LLLLLCSHTLSFLAGISQQRARSIADETCTSGRIIGVDVEVGFYANEVCVSVNFASHGMVFHSNALEL
jgi:hypothetical protein